MEYSNTDRPCRLVATVVGMGEKILLVSMMLAGLILSSTTAYSGTGMNHDEEMPEPQALLSVADFNGDGVVNQRDISKIARAVREGVYYAFYDHNADGKLNRRDIDEAIHDIGLESSDLDQYIAMMFARFGYLQTKTGEDIYGPLDKGGYIPFTISLAGHGTHWMSYTALEAMTKAAPDGRLIGKANFQSVEGLNILDDGSQIKGLFWGEIAKPLFFKDPANPDPDDLSSLDWPRPGGIWQDRRVQAFDGEPPSFTGSDEERWHTHAGLCNIMDPDTGELSLHQHTSFNECQAYENHPAWQTVIGHDPVTGEAIMGNIWGNIWMIHMWLFDLNPYGFFAGLNPDADPCSPMEETINEDREIPMWFHMHHGSHHDEIKIMCKD